jgi:hypothetical protein
MIDRLYKLVTKAASAELLDIKRVVRREESFTIIGYVNKDFIGYTYGLKIAGTQLVTVVSKRCWTFKCGSEWVKHLVDTYGKLLPGFESIPKDLPDDCKVTNYRKAVLELIRKALFKFTTKFYF